MPVAVASAGAPGPLAAAAADRCALLGAPVYTTRFDPYGDEPDTPDLPGGGLPVLVWDGDGAFAAAGETPGVQSVHAALDGAWLAIRPVAEAAMMPGERGGKVVLIAPRPGCAHGEAARAGLENLARTLGIEWARFGIRTVTILPGEETTPDEAGDLVAYLASRAGDYFSGCALTLGAAVATR